jgi:TPR repeat protein
MRTLLFILIAMASPAQAVAGQCREHLRPLLLSHDPDSQTVAELRRLCEREADDGDADASYQLALFDLGLGGAWNPEAAVPRILDAASRGVAEAQYWLAWQYEAGPLLPDDAATALGWYRRAASANHRLAIARLAQAYEAGELGLPRDPLQAAQFRAREAQCAKQQGAAAAR